MNDDMMADNNEPVVEDGTMTSPAESDNHIAAMFDSLDDSEKEQLCEYAQSWKANKESMDMKSNENMDVSDLMSDEEKASGLGEDL